MGNCTFKATNLIANRFMQCGLIFQIVNAQGVEQVVIGMQTKQGGRALLRYISTDNDNVAVRIYGLAHTSEIKRLSAKGVCNDLSETFPYLKFVVDKEDDINVHLDLLHVSDASVGDIALAVFLYILSVLDDCYETLTKFLQPDDEESLFDENDDLVALSGRRGLLS